MAGEAGRVRVTHPFHPLFNKEYDVVDRRSFDGGEQSYVEVEPGRTQGIPVAWTSIGVPDPFVVVARGRSPFRVDCLVRLAEFVAELGNCSEAEKP